MNRKSWQSIGSCTNKDIPEPADKDFFYLKDYVIHWILCFNEKICQITTIELIMITSRFICAGFSQGYLIQSTK